MQLLGLDEAGRGPWAGPIFVSIISLSTKIHGLDDSKKLTAAMRDELYDKIVSKADYIGVGAASSNYIDKHGLTVATIYSARQAAAKLSNNPEDKLIIDGNYDYLPEFENKELVVKADSKYPCVSAASVVAKVLRDRYMIELSKKYPSYGFEKHMGYGTKLHKDALLKHGACPEHRVSFKPIAVL